MPESVTWTLKVKAPMAPLGVPVIIPVPLKLRVSGSEVPPLSAHVSGPAPPFAASWRLYGLPRVAALITPVVATVGDAETATVAEAEFVWPVSLAVIVTGPEGGAPGAVNVAGAPLAVCAVIVPQLLPTHTSAQSKP